MYPRHTAGVVAPHRPGSEHFHAGALHIRQAQRPPGSPGAVLAAAALGMAGPQVIGFDYNRPPAVALAAPCGPAPDVLRRAKHAQAPKPLAGQVQLFC